MATNTSPGMHKPARRPLRPKARRKPLRKSGEWWSQRVSRAGDALTLQQKIFSGDDPRTVARSLKASQLGKSSPYRSAMSKLTFYINRAGNRLPKRRLRMLEKAKGELRFLFRRPR